MNFEFEAMNAVFALQKDLSRKAPPRSLEQRRAQLLKLLDFLKSKRKDLEAAIDADFQTRSAHETLAAEIMASMQEIQYALRHLKKWMKDTPVNVPYWLQPGRAKIKPQALGCVGIIVPWNYPLYLAISPLCAALSAGNRVMIKMSEHAPNFANFFKDEMDSIFSNEEVHVVNGESSLGVAFSNLPFDHLLFTGSSAVGKEVMKACAAHLTPVTLELGGKSPALITPKSDLKDVAQKLIYGKLFNAGQTCVAPDYVLVHKAQCEDLLAQLKAACEKLYPRLETNPDFTAIINHLQHTRLKDLLLEAQTAQLSVVPLHPEKLSPVSRKFAPTAVLVDKGSTIGLMREEIFGPILPIVTYDSMDEALAFINAKDRPLALYVFGQDTLLIEHVLNNTVSGGVTVNGVFHHLLAHELPFGGVGHSGMGAYHGKTGFDTFSKQKSIFTQSPWSLAFLLYPPYGWLFKRVMAFIMGK